MRAYEYRHVIGFEETNLVGNVYYVNHLRWQGRCREMFLRDHAPGVLALLDGDFALATVRCSCEYLDELRAFDEIVIRMRLVGQVQNRIELAFEYWRCDAGIEENTISEKLVARGEHVIACMERTGEIMTPTPVPRELQEALRPYAAG